MLRVPLLGCLYRHRSEDPRGSLQLRILCDSGTAQPIFPPKLRDSQIVL